MPLKGDRSEVNMTLMQDFLNRSVGWDCVLNELGSTKSSFPPHSISSVDGCGQIDAIEWCEKSLLEYSDYKVKK